MPSTIELSDSSVIKYFDHADEWARELKVYQSALPHVPKLLDHGTAPVCFIKLTRIAGIPYLDEPDFPISALAAAIADFHLATLESSGRCLCHIDNQPKNVLLSNGDYYLLDFSDLRMDYPETDISHLLLFWAAEFSNADFIRKARVFLSEYQKAIPLRTKLWIELLQQNIALFDARRMQHGKGLHSGQEMELSRQWLRANALLL